MTEGTASPGRPKPNAYWRYWRSGWKVMLMNVLTSLVATPWSRLAVKLEESGRPSWGLLVTLVSCVFVLVPFAGWVFQGFVDTQRRQKGYWFHWLRGWLAQLIATLWLLSGIVLLLFVVVVAAQFLESPRAIGIVTVLAFLFIFLPLGGFLFERFVKRARDFDVQVEQTASYVPAGPIKWPEP